MKRILFAWRPFSPLPQRPAGGTRPAEERHTPYAGELPACDDPGVLSRSETGSRRRKRVFGILRWDRRFDHIRKIGFRANGLPYSAPLLRRAQSQHRQLRPVIYEIEEHIGMLVSVRVEWCVIGLDPNLAYAPACSALRPFVDRYLGEKALRAATNPDWRNDPMRLGPIFTHSPQPVFALGAAFPHTRAQEAASFLDYYVCTLSWSPGYCDTSLPAKQPTNTPTQSQPAAPGFVVHRLSTRTPPTTVPNLPRCRRSYRPSQSRDGRNRHLSRRGPRSLRISQARLLFRARRGSLFRGGEAASRRDHRAGRHWKRRRARR